MRESTLSTGPLALMSSGPEDPPTQAPLNQPTGRSQLTQVNVPEYQQL